MRYFDSFADMFDSQVKSVFNMAYEQSPGIFVVKDESKPFQEGNEICRIFESPTSAIEGKSRTVELVVNDKYWNIVEPAIREFCNKYYGYKRCVDLGSGHFAFDYSNVLGPLSFFLEFDVDHIDDLVQAYLNER